MGGGGHIIIKKKVRDALALETVLEQLGPNKRAKAEALIADDGSGWTNEEFHFALRCLRDAHEAYE